MVTRRSLLKGLLALVAGSTSLGGYAFAIEPGWRLRVQRYAITPQGWPSGLHLRLAVIADLHAGPPYMTLSRVAHIVDVANALAPDMHLLLGDYAVSFRRFSRPIHPEQSGAVLARLKAPLGTHAVLGNHDWWDDWEAQKAGQGPVSGRRGLERHGIPVYENDVVRLEKNGRPFWLAGLGDQIALFESRAATHTVVAGFDSRITRHLPGSSTMGRPGRRMLGVDDLPGTLAKVTDDAPVILMAHEPDIFVKVPARVALTISGHTHGGQVRVMGWSPVVPSRYGNRFAYGHVVEDDRHLVVSGGLGCSILPMRFGVPPEIVLIELGGAATS